MASQSRIKIASDGQERGRAVAVMNRGLRKARPRRERLAKQKYSLACKEWLSIGASAVIVRGTASGRDSPHDILIGTLRVNERLRRRCFQIRCKHKLFWNGIDAKLA